MAQTIDMPARNNSPGFEVSYTTCEATLYDSGGLTDVYGNNENGIVTFCPATAGDRIRISFTMANIKANDSLKVYDGASDDAPLLLTITNTFSLDEPQEVKASQGNPVGCLTVTFRSQNLSFANVYDGWVARVSCFTPEIEPGVPLDLFRNDDPSGDGIELFDLRENDLPVLNGLSESEYQVNYFTSESDAENNVNPLDPLHTNVGNPQTIYTRLQSTATDYFAVNSFEIFVNPIPEIVPVPDLISCGENGLTPFYLAQRFPDIYNGREDLLAVFYESPEALSADADSIDPESEYLNLANPQTIYYRLIDTSTGAYAIGDFLIRTQPVPVVSTPAPITVCGNGEGEGIINLFGINQEILGGQTGLDITYHVTRSEAEEGLNPLGAEVTIRSDLEVYARVADPQNGCASIVPVSLEFHPAPKTTLREAYLLCPSTADNQQPPPVEIDTGLDPFVYGFSWFRDGVLLPGENGAAITTGIPGSYEVSLTNNEEGCSFSVSTEARLAEPPATLDISFNPQELANSYQVQVNAQGVWPYLFRLDGGVSNASGVFQNILPGAHLLTITTIDGCEVLTREFEIFGYPVFFTPNGDGINDRWSLLGAEGLEVSSVSIFDRFGRLLYVMDGSGPGWDGTSNGRQMPASSYWFRVEYISGDSLLTSSGYFALKR
jgi:gliding motility-associated-like protein